MTRSEWWEVAGAVLAAWVALFLPVESYALAFGALLAGAAVMAWVTRDDEPDGDLEAARRAYVEGEIPLSEFERRAELALDERAARVREVVEEVGGVGPSTSANIALAFDSVADLEAADREDLEAVHGVGPSTASAIRDHLGDDVDVEALAEPELAHF